MAVGLTQRVHYGKRDVVKRLRPSSSDVVDSRDRSAPEMQVHGDDVFDMHEIAPLFTGGVAMAAFEELDFAFRAELSEVMESN